MIDASWEEIFYFERKIWEKLRRKYGSLEVNKWSLAAKYNLSKLIYGLRKGKE